MKRNDKSDYRKSKFTPINKENKLYVDNLKENKTPLSQQKQLQINAKSKEYITLDKTS